MSPPTNNTLWSAPDPVCAAERRETYPLGWRFPDRFREWHTLRNCVDPLDHRRRRCSTIPSSRCAQTAPLRRSRSAQPSPPGHCRYPPYLAQKSAKRRAWVHELDRLPSSTAPHIFWQTELPTRCECCSPAASAPSREPPTADAVRRFRP